MAITRKPKQIAAPTTPIDVEALIHRGGSTPQRTEGKSAREEPVPVILRLPPAMLQQIDAQLKTRPIRTPRHTWLLEAVYEKLTRHQ